jgi:hypothetical protein
MARRHQAVHKRLVLLGEAIGQRADIILPLRFGAGPAMGAVMMPLFSTQATANWPAVMPRASA